MVWRVEWEIESERLALLLLEEILHVGLRSYSMCL